MAEQFPNHAGHDIIVIGASAGGLAALGELLKSLPADLPAAIFIAVHMHPDSCGEVVKQIIQAASVLHFGIATNGELIQYGHVYIAPPNMHMELSETMIQLIQNRQERLTPSINRLFCSAVPVFGSRIIGVVLTGLLDDGVQCLGNIQEGHGITIVQDPGEAEYPDMPQHALLRGVADHSLPLLEINCLLQDLVYRKAALPQLR